MNFFELIIENSIYILFPLSIYLIFTTYRINLHKEVNDTIFNICLCSSIYLMLYFNPRLDNLVVFSLSNIPLLLSYLKRQEATSLLLSFILIWYQHLYFNIPLLFVVLEYLIYFVIYVFIRHGKWKDYLVINSFLLINAFFLGMKATIFLLKGSNLFKISGCVLGTMSIFFVVTYLIYYLLKKGEEIMSLNSTLKDLEKEKKLRTSLFKITHEIKNPISVCKGYLDMLDLSDSIKVAKYIPIVKNEIARTLTLMDDYLDYTKIKVQKEEADICLLIEEVSGSLQTILDKNEITLTLELNEDELYINLDYNRIKQVLVNLVKNAMEAKIADQKMNIKIKLYLSYQNIIIEISDNGKGMNEEELEKVEEMFFTTKKTGTGLGVSLSKEIIELHGGTISYTSKVLKGTKVTITLPLES
ncbi:MAG: HAMP domain-containing sensor histidine kinase [Bacilli bacterium]